MGAFALLRDLPFLAERAVLRLLGQLFGLRFLLDLFFLRNRGELLRLGLLLLMLLGSMQSVNLALARAQELLVLLRGRLLLSLELVLDLGDLLFELFHGFLHFLLVSILLLAQELLHTIADFFLVRVL